FLKRNHGFDGTFGQGAMADLATPRSTDAAGLADGKVRKVVMKYELLLAFPAGVGIEFLCVFGRPESGQHERLRFTATEQRRTVRAWQQTGLASDRPNVIEATAIKPFFIVHDQTPDGFLL